MPVSFRARVRATLDLALTAALIALAIWAALFLSTERASAQAALEWAAQGMGQTRAQAAQVDRRFARRLIRAEGRLSGVYGPLAMKAREISAACGSRVISGVRHTRVAGTRHMSLHASGRAVDMQGNPACIYARLRGWSGGYSTDYGRVRHVHISLGGREDGVRFAHRGRRTYHRYASR